MVEIHSNREFRKVFLNHLKDNFCIPRDHLNKILKKVIKIAWHALKITPECIFISSQCCSKDLIDQKQISEWINLRAVIAYSQCHLLI
jgi:hypothetical protein